MAKQKNYSELERTIAKISPYIRFVGVVGSSGELLSYYRRHRIKTMLNAKYTIQFSHIAIKADLEHFFDKDLGPVEFVWEEEKSSDNIFAIKKLRVWISIDKKVVRSEVLRIIDACLPIVKLYS